MLLEDKEVIAEGWYCFLVCDFKSKKYFFFVIPQKYHQIIICFSSKSLMLSKKGWSIASSTEILSDWSKAINFFRRSSATSSNPSLKSRIQKRINNQSSNLTPLSKFELFCWLINDVFEVNGVFRELTWQGNFVVIFLAEINDCFTAEDIS